MATAPDISRNNNNTQYQHQYHQQYQYCLDPYQSRSQQYYSGPSSPRSPPPPLPPRNAVTVFAHRPHKSSGSGRDNPLQSLPTSPDHPHHHRSRAQPSTAYGLPPQTPLTPSSESSIGSRTAGSPVSSPKSSSTTTSSSAAASHGNTPASPLSKARFKMPFRDRVARRFGETVSAPHSTSQLDHDYRMTPALPYVQDPLPTPPSTPHNHYSDSTDGYDFYLHEYDCLVPTYHNQDPTVADPRAGLGRGRRAGHGRRKNTRVVGRKGRDPSSSEETGTLVREALGPRLRRSERISKAKNGKSGSTTRPKGPGSRQVAASTGSASRSTRSSSSRSTASFKNLLDTSDGRQWGDRVTRSRSKMTDDGGKQLSPTSPFLSCK